MTETSYQTCMETHRLVSEYRYEIRPVRHGYAGRTLYINLSDGVITAKPVTQEMKDKFTGGKGFGLWLLWNGTTPQTKWDDPENELVLSMGPIGGITAYPGTGKSTVVSPRKAPGVDVCASGPSLSRKKACNG